MSEQTSEQMWFENRFAVASLEAKKTEILKYLEPIDTLEPVVVMGNYMVELIDIQIRIVRGLTR